MKKLFSVFNTAEWIVIIIAIVVVAVIAQGQKSPYREIILALPHGLFGFLIQHKIQANGDDSLGKPPEQVKTDRLSKRRAEYDRDLANRMRAKGMAQSAAPRKQDSAKYKKLLSMVGGDRAVADRLVSSYGIDKAIHDLIRDRRV